MTACVPSGGTDGPLVGDGADGDTDGDGTGGADVTDGDPLPGFGGTSDAGPTVAAELTGVAEVGALGSCVLAGADGAAPTWLRWLEQPAAVVASSTTTAAITACDAVRITL